MVGGNRSARSLAIVLGDASNKDKTLSLTVIGTNVIGVNNHGIKKAHELPHVTHSLFLTIS